MTLSRSTQTSGDLAINITNFKRHLAVTNKSPNTVKSYLEACPQLAQFVKDKGDSLCCGCRPRVPAAIMPNLRLITNPR